MGQISVVVSLGSNFGLREESVSNAIDFLRSLKEDDFEVSHIYETPDIHGLSHPYMNAVAFFSTSIALKDLSIIFKDYEILHGRTPEMRLKGLVPIDIDIVIVDGNIIRPKDFRCDFFRIGYESLGNNRILSGLLREVSI
ncbi:MAG: 2-amino-4-hydroxy-6-hydroxymethyldihydropteridine diphosphokinase [Bacteroidales bacterium]|nr:2-amino-4-hydroxy-6-hydroxymethyldihydropteridine diphosphokinase [Bacteroidales bacterium]